jgi:hypothetical protein
LEFDVPQSRISTREDQTTLNTDTNTQTGSFILCAMSGTAMYNIPTGNTLKWNISSVFLTNK